MRNEDKEVFFRTWAAAWEQCGKSVTEGALKMAFECLRHYTIEDIQQAVLKHAMDVNTGQFAPKVADVVRQIDGIPEDKALLAWPLVQKGICGAYGGKPVVFDDPYIHRVVQDMGGFSFLGNGQISAWPYVQKEFIERYCALKRTGGELEYPSRLAPSSDYGDLNGEPELIGDRQKCLQVMSQGKALLTHSSYLNAV